MSGDDYEQSSNPVDWLSYSSCQPITPGVDLSDEDWYFIYELLENKYLLLRTQNKPVADILRIMSQIARMFG